MGHHDIRAGSEQPALRLSRRGSAQRSRPPAPRLQWIPLRILGESAFHRDAHSDGCELRDQFRRRAAAGLGHCPVRYGFGNHRHRDRHVPGLPWVGRRPVLRHGLGGGVPRRDGAGATGPTLGLGTRRRGLNRIDAQGDFFAGISANILMGDFDNGVAANDAFGFSGLPNLGLGIDEVDIASGDQGGPTFLAGRIAGVHSFGASFGICPPDIVTPANLQGAPGCKLDSIFGEFFGDTRVSCSRLSWTTPSRNPARCRCWGASCSRWPPWLGAAARDFAQAPSPATFGKATGG